VLDREQLERWLFGAGAGQRRIQDSPISPEVWYVYALPPDRLESEHLPAAPLVRGGESERRRQVRAGLDRGKPRWEADLLLRPRSESSAAELAKTLDRVLRRSRAETHLAFNDAYVACRLTFQELVRDALPLTKFWRELWPGHPGLVRNLLRDRRGEIADFFERGPRQQGRRPVKRDDIPGNLIWLLGLVGRIAWEHELEETAERERPTAREVVDAGLRLMGSAEIRPAPGAPLWGVSTNRPVEASVWRSRIACKADAATRLFKLSCRDVRWAVIDSGIDARHPAFARRNAEGRLSVDGLDGAQSSESRVVGTWDFATIRAVLAGLPVDRDGDANAEAPAGAARVAEPAEPAAPAETPEISLEDEGSLEDQIEDWVAVGRAVDWDTIAPRLEIAHDEGYTPPADDHGTHVAGILAADWRAFDSPTPGEHDVQGMCPDILIYDLRAFDDRGASDEFQILSAMQFVRHLNAHADRQLVHGVNLSFSVRHEVDKYASGATPVCEEAHRLVGSGVIVVAAAGNEGRGGYVTKGRSIEGYRTVSITDPGNADKVITVGSTHGDKPHTYGVSYFSSRGPTGDGRAKPDLVAPGERITSPVPDAGLQSKDGTSQAAPHISGACALLIARHPELMGQPERVKQVLLETCTDLGRERAFQGAGIVDVLRAIQAV
jgi:subtilisin family serine protease